MSNVVSYRESIVLKVINFITIACAISHRMTILPDLLFRSMMWSPLSIGIYVVLELFALIINRQNGLVIKWRVLKYPPFLIILILMFLQLLIALLNGQFVSVGAVILIGLNDFLLVVLVYSLLCARKAVVPREYVIFALFNIVITLVAFILTQAHVISPYTNAINDLSPLFSGNIEAGQSYYMPGYVAIHSNTVRASLAVVSYLGWSFEPHVFCLFVIPSVLFMMAHTKKRMFIWWIILIFILLEAFSVTAFLAAVGCAFIYMVTRINKGREFFVGLIILVIIASVIGWVSSNYTDANVLDYTQTKLVEETGSADYSSNLLRRLLLPDSAIGDGFFCWDIRHTHNPNVGLLSWPFVIAYFIVVGYHIIRTLRSSGRNVYIAVIGVLYVFLHMLKLAYASFTMPFLFLMLVVLYRAEEENYI